MYFILSGSCAVALLGLLAWLLLANKSGGKKESVKDAAKSLGAKIGSKFGKKFKEMSIKKFTTSCDFGGQAHPVTLYIGNPKQDSHPLQFQSTWLSKNRGGSVPPTIMDSFSKIAKIADEKHVPFPDLCQYVVDELNSSKSLNDDAQQASEFQNKRTAQKLAGDSQKKTTQT